MATSNNQNGKGRKIPPTALENERQSFDKYFQILIARHSDEFKKLSDLTNQLNTKLEQQFDLSKLQSLITPILEKQLELIKVFTSPPHLQETATTAHDLKFNQRDKTHSHFYESYIKERSQLDLGNKLIKTGPYDTMPNLSGLEDNKDRLQNLKDKLNMNPAEDVHKQIYLDSIKEAINAIDEKINALKQK